MICLQEVAGEPQSWEDTFPPPQPPLEQEARLQGARVQAAAFSSSGRVLKKQETDKEPLFARQLLRDTDPGLLPNADPPLQIAAPDFGLA